MTKSSLPPSTSAEPATGHTTINSLAPELIARILELAVEDDTTADRSSRQAVLRSASLVCRKWSPQGQRLLLKQISIRGIRMTTARVEGLVSALRADQVCDELTIDLYGLPWAVDVLAKAPKANKVWLLARSPARALDEDWHAHKAAIRSAEQHYDQFIPRAHEMASFVEANFVRVEASWWLVPTITGWLNQSLQSSANTLRHLALNPTYANLPTLTTLLTNLNLHLDSFTLIDPRASDGLALFDLYPHSKLALEVSQDAADARVKLLEYTNVTLHALKVVLDGNLLKAGPLLQACLDTPATTKLQLMTVHGKWAKTFIYLTGWKEFAAKATARGVQVRLVDIGTLNRSEPEEVDVGRR